MLTLWADSSINNVKDLRWLEEEEQEEEKKEINQMKVKIKKAKGI